MGAWKWCTCGSAEGKCHSCGEPLRLYRNQLVEFEGNHWHVHCLLDYLVEHYTPALDLDLTPDAGNPWGMTRP